ncbi:hypothetical protein DV736_g2165, partial [Chaetothyriales sp. CBS 134916]
MSTTPLKDILGVNSEIQLILFSLVLAILAIPAVTWLVSTIRFHSSLRYFQNAAGAKSLVAHLPPLLPYNMPILGHALAFLSNKPGSFHRRMQRHFAAHPHVGCLSVLLAGQRAHILADADLIQRLFKARGLSRERFTRDIMVKANGLSLEDDFNAYVMVHPDGLTHAAMNEEVNKKHLLPQPAVNVLTSQFMEVLQQRLKLKAEPFSDRSSSKEIPLYLFVRDNMFVASTTALHGSEIFKHNPDLNELFWPFVDGTLARLFQLGRFVAPDAYKALDTILDRWEQWYKHVQSQANRGHTTDADADWDPLTGARAIRARQRMYQKLGLSERGCASFDLGFMFGLNSNAIPATGWTLCHLLQPRNAELLAHVRSEVERARNPTDGSINMASLMGDCTYLNSCLHETMRCYVDVLITRTLTEDFTLGQYLMRKEDIIIAPSYVSHHDPVFWSQAPVCSSSSSRPENVWYGERFLKHDAATGKVSFSTAGTAGRFFPFGGGTYLCPGRMFAKQEVFGAIASFLSLFDVEFVEYASASASASTGKAGDANDNMVATMRRKGTDERMFPTVKQQFTGAGTVCPDGDVLVRIRRRE